MPTSKQPLKFLSWKNRNIRLTLCLLGFFSVAIVLAAAGLIYASLRLSLNDKEVEGFIPGLTQSVVVEKDQFGVPVITADSSLDGFRALGYVTARDRLFQMDLLRRSSAGRLAEIFGEAMISADKEQRVLDFDGVAREIALRLPAAQREVLEAYAEGVNSVLDDMLVAPFEFLLLGYHPERWRIEDSLLIVLSMFQKQSNSEDEERMLSVMERALPHEVYKFLTPMTDHYTREVLREEESLDDDYQVPTKSLATLLNHVNLLEKPESFVRHHRMLVASNAWAVAGTKTKDGRAILANDMHTTISIPNIWYRCQLRLGGNDIAGVTLPGTPLMIAGASRYLAWGLTALMADVLDLVKIELNPEDQNQYRTPDGWKPFEIRHETIQVKAGLKHEIDVKTTIWGPVALKTLLNQKVAIRWTVLDPGAVNVGLLDIYEARTLEEGLAVINNTGGPPLNAILADNMGRVAWTTMGRLPLRRGFDGALSRSWSDGSVEWIGYILPEQLPRVIDPSDGFVVNANNRSVDRNYPFTVGHAYSNGYRAHRIAEHLHMMDFVNEKEMFQLQLDTKAGVYGVYRDIALRVLNPEVLEKRPELRAIHDYLDSWNGHANVESLGLAMLVEFRIVLARAILEPILFSCRVLDHEFEYDWGHLDIPLQALLQERNFDLLSGQERTRHLDWDAFLLTTLEQVAQTLLEKHAAKSLHELTWGKVNIADYAHPLSRGIPRIAHFLNLPRDSLPGCDFCVRVDAELTGATERLVISPAHWEDGILQIPGGQSGHPLSDYYRDQHPYWVKGQPIHFVSEVTTHRLKLIPASRNESN